MFEFLKRKGRGKPIRQELDDVIRERPTQCAKAIDALLDRIAPPIADEEELARRGQALAQLALTTSSTMQEVGIASPYPPFNPNSPSATLDAMRRLIDVEREARTAAIDGGITGPSHNEPLYAAQALRWALEEPRKKYFLQPDAYSGAKWAKAVSANGRLDYFLAGMAALDPSGDLAEQFINLHDALAATGYRLPVTPDEQVSYALLLSIGS